jgi:hypothetical protein
VLVTFPVYRGRASCTFTCPACKKEKRKRTFTCEHTVNPFNTNPDGTRKLAPQVIREAQAAALLERDQFMVHPLCKKCEDARSWSEMKVINEHRRARPGLPADRKMNEGTGERNALAMRVSISRKSWR